MLIFNRHKKILELLEKKQTITVTELCKTVYASEATIRRDLHRMENEHLLIRVRGGATLFSGNNEDPAYTLRSNANTVAKEKIADIAVKYIKEGMTIFLDSSSTICAFAKRLGRFKNLTVLTNGLTTATALRGFENINVLMCGGTVLNSISTVGAHTAEMINSYKADIFVFSCRGVSEDGFLTDAEDKSADIKKIMLKNSKHKILLCDSSKIGKEYFCKLINTKDLNLIITDDCTQWNNIDMNCKIRDCQ